MADSTLNVFLGRGNAATMAALVPSPPTPASGPASGYTFFNTTDSLLYAWSGAAWVVASGAGGGVPATVQGDILYASGTNTLAALAKNTSATRYLSNTGG